MSWILATFHLFVFALAFLAWSGKFKDRFVPKDYYPLFIVVFILGLSDLGESIPYHSLMWFFPEEGFIETAQIFLEILCGCLLVVTCFLCREIRYKAVYLLYASIFFWIALEELSYGVDYFHISNPGTLLKTLIAFNEALDVSTLGTWAIVLWFLRNMLEPILQITIVLILISPSLSLDVYERPGKLIGAFRAKYRGPSGFVILAHRLAPLVLFAIIRHVLPSLTGHEEEKQIDESAFLICSTIYIVSIVQQQLSKRKLKSSSPTASSQRFQNLRRPALLLLIIGWATALVVTTYGPRLQAIPAELVPADAGEQGCAPNISLENILIYPKGEFIVVEGFLNNGGHAPVDIHTIKAVFYSPENEILQVRMFDPFDASAAEVLALFTRIPIEDGKRRFFHTVIDGRAKAARIGLSLTGCDIGEESGTT